VKLVDAAGEVVATYSNGTAHDASVPAAGPAGVAGVSVSLAQLEASIATIVVSVDPSWLAARAARIPSPSTQGAGFL
jgi:1-aminocyclopropane-1-carboxylate deaminase/D-cysteine desulfhydrase-like pyridoxal-dependent ACC family enzyme